MKSRSWPGLLFSTSGHVRSFCVPYHPARYRARAESLPVSCITRTSSGEKSELLMDFTLNWNSRKAPLHVVHTKTPNVGHAYCGARPPWPVHVMH